MNQQERSLGKETISKAALATLAVALTGCTSAVLAEGTTQTVIHGTADSPTHISQVNVDAWLDFNERCKQEGLEVNIRETGNPEHLEKFCVPGMTPLGSELNSNAIFETPNGTIKFYDSSRQPGDIPEVGGSEATAVQISNQ